MERPFGRRSVGRLEKIPPTVTLRGVLSFFSLDDRAENDRRPCAVVVFGLYSDIKASLRIRKERLR